LAFLPCEIATKIVDPIKANKHFSKVLRLRQDNFPRNIKIGAKMTEKFCKIVSASEMEI
jgi:hypothetical protein